MFGSKTLKVLKLWFWLLNLVLSLCYLRGLNFWMLDKPVIWGITCNSASRKGIALAEWGLTSLSGFGHHFVASRLFYCYAIYQGFRASTQEKEEKKKKKRLMQNSAMRMDLSFCVPKSLYTKITQAEDLTAYFESSDCMEL